MAGEELSTDKTATRSSKLKYILIVVLIAICIPVIRKIADGEGCQSKARMDGKFVIITGANAGIGKETAKDLIKRGARVLMACRNQAKCSAAAEDIFQTTGHRPEVKVLDLADLDSVRQFAKDINKQESRLDVLINNAGVMMTPKLQSKQGYELQFATNHLAHFLLTQELLPLIKKSAPSRIVIVSSKLHAGGVIDFDDINGDNDYGPLKAYSQSKLANVLHANALAEKLKGSGVTVYSLHPGVIATDLQRHAEDMVPGPLQVVTRPLLYLIKLLVYKTPERGAQTQICCAVAEELKHVTGKYYSDCAEKELTAHASDKDTARRLWTLSEKMVGLKNKGR